MAPVKPKGKAPKKGAKSAQKPTSAPPFSAIKKKGKGPPPTQQKTKSAKSLDKKKPRKKQWTAEQLGVPKLNAITPIGVQKPRGKKKGKVFVDDPHTMQTILALVNAETEGKIESKMLRARQMEEIRDAREREAEAKAKSNRDVIEKKKDELRKGGRRPNRASSAPSNDAPASTKTKKKVSFG